MDKRNYITAIDAGSGTITIAVGGQNDEGQLVLKGIVTRPMRGISRGEIENRLLALESLREAVREVEDTLGVRLSDVYTSTSGRHVRSTGHDYYVFVGERSDGEIRPEDVAALHSGMDNVQAEDGVRIMDRIPGNFVIDGHEKVKDPVGRFGKKLDARFNFVLGSSTLIDRLEKALGAENMRARRVWASAVASGEAVLLPEEKEMGVAVVDMGAGTTDLCIWHDGAVKYVRGIPFGTGDIEGDIKQQGILEKHVEGLKKSYGVAMARLVTADKLIAMPGLSGRDKREISQRNLAIIIENRLREIIGFIMDEIGEAGYGSLLKAGIVLTGGGSRLTGIDELFRDATGMDVRIALPDVHIDHESLSKAQDPAHATVIGLLLKGLAESSPAATLVATTRTAEGSEKGKDTTRTGVKSASKSSKSDPEEPSKGNANDDYDDEDNNGTVKHGIFSRLFGNLKDSLSSDVLDGDEDF